MLLAVRDYKAVTRARVCTRSSWLPGCGLDEIARDQQVDGICETNNCDLLTMVEYLRMFMSSSKVGKLSFRTTQQTKDLKRFS